MNTYIISSKDLKAGREKAEEIITLENVDRFERTEEVFEKDLGIEDIRNIKKKIFLKPLRGARKSNVLILKKGATIQAQNAMLKLLEEPPPSSIIILVAGSYRIFLPTILSRVKVIEIKDQRKIKNDGIAQILVINGAGDGLYLAEVVSKDKAQAIIWLENCILSAREEMLKNIEDPAVAKKYQKLISALELAYSDLKNTNVNTRLTLENLFLNI